VGLLDARVRHHDVDVFERADDVARRPLEFRAVDQQMRPILMMTLSACIGLLPAALSTGIGSQVQRPLATVIVGGMLIGPVLLLVIVPALQSYFIGGEGTPEPQLPQGEGPESDMDTHRS